FGLDRETVAHVATRMSLPTSNTRAEKRKSCCGRSRGPRTTSLLAPETELRRRPKPLRHLLSVANETVASYNTGKMKSSTKLTSKGQVVIPKRVRDRLDW